MRAEARILRLVHPDNGGPRARPILDAMAKQWGEGPHLIDYLIAAKRLVKYGQTRAARWGLPKKRAN